MSPAPRWPLVPCTYKGDVNRSHEGSAAPLLEVISHCCLPYCDTSPSSIDVTQSLSHHFLHPNDPLRSATSGQHLWTTFSLSNLELPHPCGLSLDLCLIGFPLNPQAMLYIDQVPSSPAQTLPEPQKSISLRHQHIQFWNCEGLFIVFCCNESFCSYVYKSKHRENDTAIPVYFHIFGEMWKGRNYSAVLTAVRAGAFHYTVLTLSHSLLGCHLSSFQICSSFACISITVPLVPALLVGVWVERDGHMKLSQMNCSWDNEVEVAGA